MRKVLIGFWMTIPFLAWAYHVGPGQEKLRMDEAGVLLEQASARTAANDFASAKELFQKSLAKIPADRKSDGYPIRLELARAQMGNKELPEARAGLESLLDEASNDPKADSDLIDEVRETLGHSQYYMTWLMRLEGRPAEEWELEAEGARQNFRLLAEKATGSGDQTEAVRQQVNLESIIQLARMELSSLQALGVPKPCKGTCSDKYKKPRPRKPSIRKPPEKGEQGGLNPLPEGSGS